MIAGKVVLDPSSIMTASVSDDSFHNTASRDLRLVCYESVAQSLISANEASTYRSFRTMILVCRRHTKCAGQGVLQDRFGNHCFNVLASQNAYPSIETNISQTQFYLLFLTNYYRCCQI